MIQLFPDQQRLIDDTRALMRQHKSVLVQAATGSGKTVMAAYMVKAARDKGSRAIMVVPRRELLRQTSETFRKFGIPHTFVAAGHGYCPFERTILATSGTLAKRLDKLPAPQLVFIDETHYGGAELDRIIRHYQQAGAWVLGLSATPVRLDGRGLGCWYQAMSSGPAIHTLIDERRLSDYRLFAPSTPDLSGIKTTAGDYAKGELASFMEQDRVLIGNAVSHYRQHGNGRLNVCYCVSIAHAEIVAGMFNDAGIPAKCITGKMTDDERKAIIRAFARREIRVLTSVDLLTFGFDLSAAAQMDVTVECMSDLRPTKSLALQMQKWGRVLRMKDEPALILDHAGNAAAHGLPDDQREWSLEGRAKRQSSGEKADPVRQCGKCFYVHRPSPACPKCGYEYPVVAREVEHIDGELMEITAAQQRRQAAYEQAKAQTLEELIALAKRTGKNPRWAYHVYNARRAKNAG